MKHIKRERLAVIRMRKLWASIMAFIHTFIGPREQVLPPPGCAGCRHYLGGGMCHRSLELECGDGGFEAREEITC